MNDRELLELAARAAGINIFWFAEGEHYCIKGTGIPWEPLRDPGDALRLAVALRIDVTFNEEEVFAFGIGDGESEAINVSNPLAATMRAITRAAAEIGKEIK